MLGDVTDLGKKLVGGAQLLSEVRRDEDVEIGTTPKDEVWRSDNDPLSLSAFCGAAS